MNTVASQPRRRAVAAYDSYIDAQRAVDRLSDRGFPVDRWRSWATGSTTSSR